jgi:hypothetical protein
VIKALTKAGFTVEGRKGSHVKLKKEAGQNFYHMDESDYTVMLSDKDPATIIITV